MRTLFWTRNDSFQRPVFSYVDADQPRCKGPKRGQVSGWASGRTEAPSFMSLYTAACLNYYCRPFVFSLLFLFWAVTGEGTWINKVNQPKEGEVREGARKFVDQAQHATTWNSARRAMPLLLHAFMLNINRIAYRTIRYTTHILRARLTPATCRLLSEGNKVHSTQTDASQHSAHPSSFKFSSTNRINAPTHWKGEKLLA